MTLDPGTVAYWRDFEPGHNKFIYILGVSGDEVFSFTISSQAKYLLLESTRNQMVEIPHRSTDFLDRPSWIQCFYEVTRTSIAAFRALEASGAIMWRAYMPAFIPTIAKIVYHSQLLPQEDVEAIGALVGIPMVQRR